MNSGVRLTVAEMRVVALKVIEGTEEEPAPEQSPPGDAGKLGRA